MKMTQLLLVIAVLEILSEVVCEVNIQSKNENTDDKCNIVCPEKNGEMVCGFDPKEVKYQMFSSKCAMKAYGECHNIGFFETALHFCIRNQLHSKYRRYYGESCPVFCPSHYRPVCAASRLRSYAYRTFNNGCFLDMLNCRGDEDNGYVEVGLEFCQRHLMKNIFKETVVISRFDDYRDYGGF